MRSAPRFQIPLILVTALVMAALAVDPAVADFICFCTPVDVCCNVGINCTPDVVAPRVIYSFYDLRGVEFARYDSDVDLTLKLPVQLQNSLPDGAFSVEYTGPDMRLETGGDCQDIVLEFADSLPTPDTKAIADKMSDFLQKHPGGRIPVTKVGNRSPIEGWNGAAEWFQHYGRVCRALPGTTCEWALQVFVEWVEGVDVVVPTESSNWGTLKARY